MQNLLRNLAKIPLAQIPQGLPKTPGIYIFWAKNRPIYIGKSVNIRNRVASHFDRGIFGKTAVMVSKAEALSFIKVASDFEALLLEARLIYKLQPQYNVISRDDKSPLYICITDEEYPRVITGRKAQRAEKNLEFLGPFPSSKNVRSVLKMIRRIFPYADHKVGKKACFYNHLGLCNPCPSELEQITNRKLRIEGRKKYLANIRKIVKLLHGEFTKLRAELTRQMKSSAKSEDFENAQMIKNQIEKLDYITTSSNQPLDFLKNPNFIEDVRNRELLDLKLLLENCKLKMSGENLTRIECFDVAHLAGTYPTASMVTFVNGEPDKSLYRHFRVRGKKGNNDVASLTEVIRRRILHLGDWGTPDLIIVDGGRGQVNAFTSILYSNEVRTPVVGVTKRQEILIIPLTGSGPVKFEEIRLTGNILGLIQRIRNEAHRFTRRYHHNLIRKSVLI